MKKTCHNELNNEEIWLGNIAVNSLLDLPEHLKKLKTIRLGKQAFDIKGLPLDPLEIRPLILHKSEQQLYETIQKERLAKIKNKYQ